MKKALVFIGIGLVIAAIAIYILANFTEQGIRGITSSSQTTTLNGNASTTVVNIATSTDPYSWIVPLPDNTDKVNLCLQAQASTTTGTINFWVQQSENRIDWFKIASTSPSTNNASSTNSWLPGTVNIVRTCFTGIDANADFLKFWFTRGTGNGLGNYDLWAYTRALTK
jgi:hypothetical protein